MQAREERDSPDQGAAVRLSVVLGSRQSSSYFLRSFCPFEDTEEERRSPYTEDPLDRSARQARLISEFTVECLDDYLEIIMARNSRAAAAAPDIPALTKKLRFNGCLDSQKRGITSMMRKSQMEN